MPQNSDWLVRLAEIEIDRAHVDAYDALLRQEIEASVRLEPGVVMLHAVAEKERPEHIRILEVYADRQAYEAHLLTPHFLKYKASTATMVRSLRLVEAEPIALCSK